MKSPLGLPSELIGAVTLLPVIAERLGSIVEILSSVSRDTKCLPAVNDHLADVERTTAVLPAMDVRIQTIEEAMPALVEVQQHLSDLPDTISRLDSNVTNLGMQIDRLLGALGQLDHDVHMLSESVEPLGRLAERMPGKNKR